jgi:uncharacterized delta-60 repeat protein
MRNNIIILTALLVTAFTISVNAQPGSLDSTFNSGAGADYSIWSTAIQSDGKIIVGGGFTTFGGVSSNRIARLNTDGVHDATFNVGSGANNDVATIAIQSIGKILIGGGFTSYNGVAINRIARLNGDGSLDATFAVGTGANDYVSNINVQSNGKILIAGSFFQYNGLAKNCIARLDTDGSIDASFTPGTGANNAVWTTAIQSDGKIIIGGDFTEYNGIARTRIARLNADGSLDLSFNPGTGFDNRVYSLGIQSDGKIIIGGDFTDYNGTVIRRIARLNTDGSLDASFNVGGTGANGIVNSIIIKNDGKILIVGSLTAYNGTQSNHIANLNADGSLDATFNIGTGASGNVFTSKMQNDGGIIIGGFFASYNGIIRNNIARIKGTNNVGIEFIENNNSAKIYPNPFSDELTIEFEGSENWENYKILNMLAEVVKSGSLTGKTKIETSQFAPGIYFIKLDNGKSFEFKKIIKK